MVMTATDPLDQCAIGLLCLTVLLWCVRNSELVVDTTILHELSELISSILAAIISAQNLDLPPCLVFHACHESFEYLEGITFIFGQEYPNVSRFIIHKCCCILRSPQRNRKWSY